MRTPVERKESVMSKWQQLVFIAFTCAAEPHQDLGVIWGQNIKLLCLGTVRVEEILRDQEPGATQRRNNRTSTVLGFSRFLLFASKLRRLTPAPSQSKPTLLIKDNFAKFLTLLCVACVPFWTLCWGWLSARTGQPGEG